MGASGARTVPIDQIRREVLRDRPLVGRPRHRRPRTREECPTERPCPFVSCRYHLYLDVDPERGSIKYNFPGLRLDQLPDTCALDVADRGALDEDGTRTLAAAGAALGLTRARVAQIVDDTCAAIAAGEAGDAVEVAALADLLPGGAEPWQWRPAVDAVSPR